MTGVLRHDGLLVDSSCATGGYVTDLQGDFAADAAQVALLCRRHGVGALLDVGSGWAAAQRLATVERAPVVVGGVWALTDSAVRNREEIRVGGAADVASAVEAALPMSGGWIGARSSSPDFLTVVGEQAHSRGLKVVGRGAAVLEAAEAGQVDLVGDVVSLLPSQESPVSVLTAAGADGGYWR